jgi:two-component system, LytTR family, sensor kinase
MQPLTLNIPFKEWLRVIGVALFFAITLSVLNYFLLSASLMDGLMFGVLLGVSLSICAFVFTSALNHFLLPTISPRYWLLIAGISSFNVGFIGTFLTYALCHFFHVMLLVKFEAHILLFAFFIGVLSYVVSYLLYQFVMVNYAKEYHQKLLMESRLKSLERQLNPHFLFNALNSLSELLHVSPHKAEKALLDLSDFLRFSMKENARITLSDEIENVKRYVGLENIRFGGKILLDMTIDKTLLQHYVPKFSIQLIVENAIKHGFNAKPLAVWIDAHKDEDLVIIIGNDGKPMMESSFGIGLCNLQERLGLLCQGEIILTDTTKPTFKMILREFV